jgi:hypothetical protein
VAVDALTNFGSGLTALTIDGNAMTTVFELVDANGYLHREAWADLDGITGTVNLVVTFADIPDEGALVAWQPIAGVDFAAGVVDSGTEEDFNTTFSIALTGLAAGDFLVYSLSDFGDTTHTPSGVLVEDSETASADGVSLALGHFEATGASHTGGWTAGGFGFGGAWAMTPAEDAGGGFQAAWARGSNIVLGADAP